MLSALLSVSLTLALATARIHVDREQQPLTQLPMVGGLASLAHQGRTLEATGPPAKQNPTGGLGAIGDKTVCNVYAPTESSPPCEGEYPFPACCDNSFCSTNADGSGGKCSTTAPSPACCPAFSRASDRCNLPDGTGTCSVKTYPVPACCDKDYCYVFTDASATQCAGGKVAGCCPA